MATLKFLVQYLFDNSTNDDDNRADDTSDGKRLSYCQYLNRFKCKSSSTISSLKTLNGSDDNIVENNDGENILEICDQNNNNDGTNNNDNNNHNNGDIINLNSSECILESTNNDDVDSDNNINNGNDLQRCCTSFQVSSSSTSTTATTKTLTSKLSSKTFNPFAFINNNQIISSKNIFVLFCDLILSLLLYLVYYNFNIVLPLLMMIFNKIMQIINNKTKHLSMIDSRNDLKIKINHNSHNNCRKLSSNLSNSNISSTTTVKYLGNYKLFQIFLILSLIIIQCNSHTINNNNDNNNVSTTTTTSSSLIFPSSSAASAITTAKTLKIDNHSNDSNEKRQQQQQQSPGSSSSSYTLNDYNQAIKQHVYSSPHLFCGDPPIVPNAQSNLHRHQKHFVFPVGQEATYECEQGFRSINGNAQTRCIIEGVHLPSASHVLFPDVYNSDSSPHSSNARIVSNRWKNSKRLSDVDDDDDVEHHLNSATVDKSSFIDNDFLGDKRKMSRKNDGNDDIYDLDSMASVNNKQRAHWFPMVTLNCQPVNCSQPLEIPNAQIAYNKSATPLFAFNSNVHYVCNDGYETIGFPVLTCRADGQWNRQPPECRLKQCPLLPELKNGRISYSDSNRKIHSRADYICDHGYRLNAMSSTRICGSNDQWSPLEQYYKTAAAPSINIVNSTKNDNNISNNSTNETYQCIAVTCPNPVRPHNGLRIVDANRKQRKNKNAYTPGDIIIFSCISNRMKLTAKCREDGEWSQAMPHCPVNEFSSLKCAPISTFSHGSVKIVNQTRAVFSCIDGYELDGLTSINCNVNGAWSGPLPRCVMKMVITTDQHPTTTDPHNHHSSHLSDSNGDDLDNEERSISNTLLVLLIIIFILSLIIISIGVVAFCRWRQRRMNSKVWQRYFGHYYHRQSKTNIMLSTHFGSNHHHSHHMNGSVSSSTAATNNMSTAISTAGSTVSSSSNSRLLQRGFRSKINGINNGVGVGYLQSSFSSADDTAADLKSTAETITSERARTISTYVADDTCAEDDEYDDEDDDDEDLDRDDMMMINLNDDYSPSSIYKSTTFPTASTIVHQQHSLPLNIGHNINNNSHNGTNNNTNTATLIDVVNVAKRTLSSDNNYIINSNNNHNVSPPTTTITLNKNQPTNTNNHNKPIDLFDIKTLQQQPKQHKPQSSSATATTTITTTNGGIPVTDL